MRFENLRELHRRVNAPQADTSKPLPLEGALVVCASEPIPPLQSYPVTTSISLYNCGTQNCTLISVEALAPGVHVQTRGGTLPVLPAFTPRTSGVKFDVELRPLELAPDARAAEILVRWRDISSRKTGSSKLSLSWTIASGVSTGILFGTKKVSFDNLWVDDLRVFSRRADGAKAVNLHIESGPAKGVYAMGLQGDRYVAAVYVPRGAEANYRFSADGVFSTDDTVQETTYVTGVATPCTVLPAAGTLREKAKIQNRGSEAIRLTVATSAQWLQCDPAECVLRAGAAQELAVSIQPELLFAGEHQANLTVSVNTGRNVEQVEILPVSVNLRAAGPLCRHKNSYDLGSIYFGEDKPRMISVANFGDATLEVLGFSDRGALSVPKHKIAPGKHEKLSVNFDFRQMSPENGVRESTLILQTNSYVDSRKKLEIKLAYTLVALRMRPESINFPAISKGEIWERSIYVSLGADPAMIKELVIERAPPWATWRRDSSNGSYIFTITGDLLAKHEKVPNGSGEQSSIRGEVILKDSASGARGRLTIRGTFAHPMVRGGKLNFGRVSDPAHLPLPVTNNGLGDLIIEKVVIDAAWLQVRRASGVASGLEVVASRRPGTTGKQEAEIRVHTNDPKASMVVVPVKANFEN